MSRSLRTFAVAFALIALPLAALVAAGSGAALHLVRQSRDAAITQTAGAVGALVADAAARLRHEVSALARDPALIEATSRSDWATLARLGAPRIVGLVRAGAVDLVVVRDAAGVPIVQVPPTAAAPIVPPSAAPSVALRTVGGEALLIATASIESAPARDDAADRPAQVGTIVMGRRLDALTRALGAVPGRPEVVLVAGDRIVGSTEAALPTSGWTTATAAGRLDVGGEVWAVRSLGGLGLDSATGALWALVPAARFRVAEWKLRLWLAAVVAVSGLTLALGIWMLVRWRDGARGAGPPDPGRRDREVEASNAIAVIIARGADLVRTAEATLDVVRRMAGIDVALVYRMDAAADVLVLVAQRGLDDEEVEVARVRPIEGTNIGDVARSGRLQVTRFADSPPADERICELSMRRGHRVQLALPIPVAEETWGVLALVSPAEGAFSSDEVASLDAVAHQVGLAVERGQLQETAAARLAENARLLAEAKQRAAEYRALFEVAGLVGSTLDLERVLDLILDRSRALLGVRSAGIFKLDPDTGVLSYERGVGLSEAFVQALRVHVGEGATGRAARDRRPAWSADILADHANELAPETRGLVAREGYRSALSVPILRAGSARGALSVYWWEVHQPTPSEITMLSALAGQAGIALDNARLYAETARHLSETRALLEVAEILNSTLDPQRLLKQVAVKIAQVCQVDRCSIERWDGDRVIPLVSQFADGRRDQRLWTAFTTMRSDPPGRVPAHIQAIETRRPVVVADASASDIVPREWTETFGHKSLMVVPLIRQDAVLGVMTLDYTDRVTPFAPRQVNLAMAIGGQLALAVENSRLYAEVQERLRETTTLLAVGRALSEPGLPVEVMRRTAREVARTFGADMVGVYLLDAAREALVPAAGYHVPSHLLPVFGTRPFVLARFPALAAGWREGRPCWSADVTRDPRFDSVTFEGVDPHSVLLAPTMVRGEAVGALFLVWWTSGRAFAPAEVRLIEGVASQVGLAMENAELGRQTQEKLEETERLLSVSRSLASTPDLETLPREFLRHVAHAVGADTAGMWLLDETGEWMEALAGYRVTPERLDGLRALRLSIVRDAFYAEAAATRRPVVSTDVMRDPRVPQALRDVAPHRTQLFVPIVAKDRMLGGFAAIWVEERRDLGEGELRLMEAIASQAGVALENARLFRDNQRRVGELSVLYELSRAVTGQLDQADLLETIREHVARLLEVRHIVVLLHDDESRSLDVALRAKDGVRSEAGRYAREHAGLSAVVLETRRPIRTSDYLGECARRGVDPFPESVDLPHWLGVPMVAGLEALGVLALRSRDRAFTERDQRVLTNVADLAALALRSARLYEERARAHADLAAAQDHLVRTEKLRALGEMASGVAHDFNNVLAAILGRAQLLLKELSEPKLRQWVEVIERAATDGALTVRRLQDFTRIRRDQPAVPVDLNEIVRQTLEATESTWRQEARSRGVEIEVRTRLTAPLPEVLGDPAELREALTNLILNALDAMPGGGTLDLSTTAGAGHVEVAVADSGVGIPAAVRDRIFDPFFTTKGPKGTGLGLSMTYGILTRHEARITVESAEGRGTTFRLRFPVPQAVDAGLGPAAAPLAPAPALRCLVVDDEEAVATVLGDMLLATGHRVEIVGNGADAIARFAAESFDLVLTDLAMPGMTGWEVARAIKRVAPRTRVFLVSGFGVEVSPEDLRENGVDLVLAKPLRFQDIESALAIAHAGGDA